MSGSLGFHYDKPPHVKLEGNTFLTKKLYSLGHKILMPKVKKKMKTPKGLTKQKYKPYSVRILVQNI